MSASSTAPSLHDVSEPIAKRLDWPLSTPSEPVDPTSFIGETHTEQDVEDIATELLACISDQYDISTFVRIELIYQDNDTDSRRGALLFDGRSDAPIIHITDAFLGCAARKAVVGQVLLEAIGVPADLAEEMHRDACCPPYMIVGSRQATKVIDGVNVADPDGEPGEWDYWQIR